MTKKYIVFVLIMGALVFSGVAFAQSTSVFGQQKMLVVSIDVSQNTLSLGDPSAVTNSAALSQVATNYTVSPERILVLGPGDEVVSHVRGIEKGHGALVYLRSENGVRAPYMVKVIKRAIEDGKACTLEARMCPDGSYVGRTGPSCEFARCPGEAKPTSTTVRPGVRKVCIMTRNENAATNVAACKDIPPGLQQGHRNDDVLHLQRLLQAKGLLPQDSATGYFGPATHRAVRELQKQKGLPDTGFVGNMTLEKLEQENSAQ